MTETHAIGNQMFDFETDEDSVTIRKYEKDLKGKRDDLGTVMVYRDQIDELVAHLLRLKASMPPSE